MKKEKEYVVNVGNIGNITCDTRKEAEQVYNKYVAMSKSGKGRAGNEHVSLMIDGEPVKEHFADKEEMAKGSNVSKKYKIIQDTEGVYEQGFYLVVDTESEETLDIFQFKSEAQGYLKEVKEKGFSKADASKFNGQIDKYRTGGVAGSKHVDVTRGKRLVHGYKAVKGSDKKENYSKGKKGVKVTPGWRLPHGYETTEAAYNEKYKTGGNLNEYKTYVANEFVKEIGLEFNDAMNQVNYYSQIVSACFDKKRTPHDCGGFIYYADWAINDGANEKTILAKTIKKINSNQEPSGKGIVEEYRTGGVADSKHVVSGKVLLRSPYLDDVRDFIEENDIEFIDYIDADKGHELGKMKDGTFVETKKDRKGNYTITTTNKTEKDVFRTGGNIEDELQTNLAKKIYDNIYDFIDDANENTDSPGYGIVLSNAPIFIQREGQIEFWQDMDLIQSECDCFFEISDYNDLVIKTDQYEGEFRTGGVAGSKHVDVTRGRRLIHGYKAVKGSDKQTNYSKGYSGVKVDKGWRLPHGYETTEAAYNEKYAKGKNIQMTTENAIKEAEAMGVDFDKDFHAQSFGVELAQLAKKYGYKQSKTSSGSLGRAFFYFLSKVKLSIERSKNKEYRTGGVAGSKHVDVVRGYRLVHGYKAVKGSDKQENYSKGKSKVKVDKGWRLPHGYEVVEAYYNDKYSRGGLFGSSAVVKDINDEFASDELKSELKSKMKKDDVVIAFAYTDYGGDFFDKVLIEYFEENYPDNIVVENTGWSGQNAFVFGEPAKEFVEATENYPLGFEDTESYYYEKQYEEEQEGFERFIEDDLRDYDFDTSEVMQELNEKFGGYWSVLTTGLDYSYSDMIDHLKEKGLIKEKAAKGKNVKKETLLDKIKSAGAISENQVNLVKNRMNRGAIDSETQEVIDYISQDEVKLTSEQNQKGIKFLRNLYKSPTGKVRTNNPFGNREISALDSFTHFLIVGFQNIGNSYRDNYVPVYAVIGKNGTFEYYYDGDVNVIGAKGMNVSGKVLLRSPYLDDVRDFIEENDIEFIDFIDAEKGHELGKMKDGTFVETKQNYRTGNYTITTTDKTEKDVFRTGGVAGSKHVDVAKGYRLPHGYQAVKGSDKNFDYSKGYPKVKVDKGWRLPKGYEVVDGAYNMKYMAGGSFDINFEEYLQKDDSNFYKEYKNNKFSVFTEKSGDLVEVTIDEAIDLLLNMSVEDIATLSSSTTVERISETKYEINTGGDKGGSGIMNPDYYISYTEHPKNDLYFVVLNAFREEVIENKIMPEKNNSSITESQYQRAVNHFVYFCMNYPNNFMDAFSGSMKSHLQSKFSSIYDKVGSRAAMLTFYTELDSENQKALLSWAMNNYKGTKLEEGGVMETEMLSSFDIMKKGKNVDTKGSYTILKANRAYCGVHDKTYSEAVETAKSHQCNNGLIVKGEMIWNNGRVKGIRLADGEEMMYGEYEREYFTEPQMNELKKLSKLK